MDKYNEFIKGFNQGYTFPVTFGKVFQKMYKTDLVIYDWKCKTIKIIKLWEPFGYDKSLQDILLNDFDVKKVKLLFDFIIDLKLNENQT